MHKWKIAALIVLAALSFASPALERAITGRVELLSNFGLGETLLSLIVLFWWFHLDKAEHGYRAGKLMNAGVLVLAALALPIYFIRSRGWKRGLAQSASRSFFSPAPLCWPSSASAWARR